MLPNISPDTTKAWKKLQVHFEKIAPLRMSSLFQTEPDRFEKFSISSGDLLFDYSKNRITADTLKLLIELANECHLKVAIDSMFTGNAINVTENRPVLHTALRNFSDEHVNVNATDVMPHVRRVLDQMRTFCEKVHTGKWRGYTGKTIKYIVNIGIGGSDLGPYMVTEALKAYWNEGIETFFVSNVDASQIAETLKRVNAEETLFVVASKTFTTQETMTNASTARQWFIEHSKSDEYISKHFIAVSTNSKEVTRFGIHQENMFEFWDWVGGRYSLWSAIGLSIALTVGFENYLQLLKGAYDADLHFHEQPFQQNIPVLMALIGIWYTNFFSSQTEAILPYDQYLHRFPAYLQQGNMESNGKSKDRNGNPVKYSTGPVIWGEPGTNGQHAFFQLLHQGTLMVPCDFIAPAITHNPIDDHHAILLSNFFAQTEALMNGKSESEARDEMIKKGMSETEITELLPFKTFEGNKPSNSFLLKKITPVTLGKLIAFYEHKIFVQGVIWNIFSFDQWGVELGKQLAGKILPELNNDQPVKTHDSSTNGLINTFKKMRNS